MKKAFCDFCGKPADGPMHLTFALDGDRVMHAVAMQFLATSKYPHADASVQERDICHPCLRKFIEEQLIHQ